MKKLIELLLLTVIGLTGCDNQQTSDNSYTVDIQAQTIVDTIQSLNFINSNWLDKFDFDGDSINDHIYFDFSGGAHCCYKINIVLSSDKKERKFPFEMDGSYIGGVDNSQPDQFDIRNIDSDGLPEILMRIQTYNGESETIPTKWKTDYGIKSNYIVIEYNDGQIKITDYTSKVQQRKNENGT